MRFVVHRTSNYGDDEIPPCEGARRELVELFDFRYVKIEKMNGWVKRSFFREGTYDHENFGDGSRCKYKANEWVIYISTLEELSKFHEEYGEIILAGYPQPVEGLALEIYDAYRE